MAIRTTGSKLGCSSSLRCGASCARGLRVSRPTTSQRQQSKRPTSSVVLRDQNARELGGAVVLHVCRSQEDDQSDLPPEIANDIWADEKWNAVGFLFQNFVFVVILLTGLAGGLAAKSYNDGASLFLQKATSSEDKAKIISLEDVQKARNLPQESTSFPTE